MTAANPTASVLYIENGDTQEPLLKALGQQLLASSNVVLFYVNTGSCTLTPNLYNGVQLASGTTMSYVPTTGADGGAWDPTQPSATCTLDAATTPDLGISALFPASCELGGPDAGTSIGLINGPVQAYTFIVPSASNQKAIWAEEAYYAFGFGNANKLTPWNNIAYEFTRPITKSTLVATAFNIDVPPNKWQGTPEAASSDVLNQVVHSTMPQITIGILGDEVYDANRSAGANVLAFKAFGQNLAFFPDSTSQSYDRQNVRDGHYTLWSPTVYITKVDSTNTPTNPVVKYVVDLVLGNEAATPPDGGPSIDGLATVTQSGLTPDCAMKVTRSGDGLPLSLYTPAAPCGCYFLSKVPQGSATPAGCTVCSSAAPCATGACRHGFCEAQ